MSDTTILQNNNHVIKPKNRSRFPAYLPEIPLCVPWEKAVTICTIAVTTFSIWRSTANLKKSRIY